jgi:hypothetical protein
LHLFKNSPYTKEKSDWTFSLKTMPTWSKIWMTRSALNPPSYFHRNQQSISTSIVIAGLATHT